MRVLHLGAAVVCFGCTGLLSGEALRITTTPSHTPTPTPTVTPTPSATPTGGASARPTPWTAASPEFAVNQTTGTKQIPAVALGADNRFLAVWQSEGDGDGTGIFGRLFDGAGQPLGGEFQVNTTTVGAQWTPEVDANPSGNFVVVWTSSSQDDSDISAQVLDSDGAKIGSEILVNAYTTGDQSFPDVTSLDTGFTVVWMNVGPGPASDPDGVYLRRFSPLGVPLDGDFLVNTYTAEYQSAPKVSSNSYGTVVVWQSVDQDGDMSGIYEQLYDETGAAAGPERRINSKTAGDQTRPSVAMGDFGPEYIIVWKTAGTADGDGIWGRGVNRGASFLGPDFRISANGSGHGGPKVAIDHTWIGGFVVTWSGLQPAPEGIQTAPHTPPPLDTAVFAQRFNNAPFPTTGFYTVQPPRRGETFQVDTQTYQTQAFPDIASRDDGRFVVVWQSNFEHATSGIEARRFDFPGALPMKVDTRASGGASNVNGVLEAGERVVVDPGWRTRSTPTLTLSGTAANPTGPAGPAYTIEDFTADYGAFGPDGADCFGATGDCYEFSLTGARPAAHWDATFDETLQSPDPIGPMSKTWSLHVGGSFPDVPQDSFYPFIESLLHNGVTAGGGCGPGLYCGDELVLRQQMAVFLLKAAYGQGFEPPPATGGVFEDVTAINPFAPWIEELARIGVTAGCNAPPPPALPSFCPTAPVNRQQMAAFLSLTLMDFAGWECTNRFDDVPCESPFATYIEFLVHLDVTAGCSENPPLYCPTDPTKRKQMAAFLVKTFGLQLYGPD